MAYSPHPGAFDNQLFPDMTNASSLDYTGFEDVLDGQSYLNDASPVSHPGTAYAFAGSMAGSDPSLNAMSSAGSFDNPDIWLDQNTWFNPNLKSSAALNVTSNFDSSTLSGNPIDYGYLAGENNGLLGVGESRRVSSVSPSLSSSHACYSDFLFSSPSSASSPQNFNVGESAVEGNNMHVSQMQTPSFEGRSRTASMSSSHAAVPNKNGDEAVFKAPTVPASAASRQRGRLMSPLPYYQPCKNSSNPASPFSVQDSLNQFQFPPRLHYLDESSLSNGVFTSSQSSYPSLINQHPYSHTQPQHTGRTPPYPVGFTPGAQSIPSPATSQGSSHVWNAHPRNANSQSPYYGQATAWSIQPMRSSSRRLSIHSATSGLSNGSPRHGSVEIDEDGKERTQCPYPDCGKSFKDLKAHMLTHQNERPEKCPITSCEFHKRGFARKYDRNRHLVTTHCKATIVCGFCPGSGSSAEKSFNRTDMFKAHLVKAHGVDHKPSNSKKKSPHSSARQSPSLPDDVTGKCSTCSEHFASPQELFDHFDECVLRFVTQTDPGEETNEKNLLSVAEDVDVKATMERHSLANDNGSYPIPDDDDYNSEDIEETITSTRAAKSGKGSIPNHKSHVSGASLHSVVDGHVTKNRANSAGKISAGLTHSKGGVTLAAGKGRKKRKYYPQSWGCPIDQMKLKKRVLCVFDGQRRLCKDDMMLNDDLEVRLQLPNSTDGSYVTDLDVETINRAEAFHGATEEERGPWIPSNYSGDWSLAQQQLTA